VILNVSEVCNANYCTYVIISYTTVETHVVTYIIQAREVQ